MALSLNAKLITQVVAALTNPMDLATGTVPLDYTKQIRLGTGTGANQADRVWSDQRTLAASANEDLDLSGVLTDAFGNTVTLARVKGLVVVAASANANNVIVGGAALNAWSTWAGDPTDTVVVRPGGLMALYAPDATAYAVTAATGDLLRVANSGAGTSVTYDIIVIGASA